MYRLIQLISLISLLACSQTHAATADAQRVRARTDPTEAPDLPGVVCVVLERTEVPRLRITSVEPTDAVMMLPLLTDPYTKNHSTGSFILIDEATGSTVGAGMISG